MAVEALLLSTSRVFGGEYLEYCHAEVADFFSGVTRLAFAPFAVADYEAYTEQTKNAFRAFGIDLVGLHASKTLDGVQAVFVGGGNSFRLLKALQERGLVEQIRDRVKHGELRYMGSSAGSNMACPTMRTTNDMPIVQPRSFEALGLVPFQINPHYHDPDANSHHMGETRDQRLREFLEENDVPVVGLREGAWLRRSDQQLTLGGIVGGRLFRRDAEPEESAPGADVSWLLATVPRFDAA